MPTIQKTAKLAARGINSFEELAAFSSAVIHDILTGQITPQAQRAVNAICNKAIKQQSTQGCVSWPSISIALCQALAIECEEPSSKVEQAAAGRQSPTARSAKPKRWAKGSER
jgi:hypothetical protein